MRVKTPRWLLILEGVLLLGAITVVAYKLALRVAPLPVAQMRESRQAGTLDPKAQLLEYYRKYPERYIRIVDDSWLYRRASRTAVHSFTLRNTATVAYDEIEIRFTYESRDASPIKIELVRIPVGLAPLQQREFSGIEVRDVPPGAASATATVATAVGARPGPIQ